jgi:hypothetical protein
MAESTLELIKELLTNKTNELIEDNNNITSKMQIEDICIFEQTLFRDSEYYYQKYFDEDKFERNVRTLFGDFPIEEFTSEARDYSNLYVYNRALKDFVSENNGI